MHVEQEAATLGALEDLYRSQLAAFRRFARAVLGNTESAHDAVQDGFVRAIRDRQTFRGDGTLEAWVWRCVVNAVRNANRRPRPVLGAVEDAAAHAGEHDAALRELIAQLPERQRLVLFLRYFADLDYGGIAGALEIAPGTVAASLHAAHGTLRHALEEVER
jgi:RNA polymerase sigma-70 factor, ECF subfamily